MLRVVSLVPSLTEAVALTMPETLAGATDYCTHPPALEVTRVGGSKYPDLAAILALKPGVVLMNEEENRLSDAEALEAAGVSVYATYPLTVDDALRELGELLAYLGAPSEPDWLLAARAAWAPRSGQVPGNCPDLEGRSAGQVPGNCPDLGGRSAGQVPGNCPDEAGFSGQLPGSCPDLEAGPEVRAVIPVWRKPWIVLGRDTFAGDMLRRLGVANVFGDDPERYPRPSLEEILDRRPDLIVLPDEPYAFSKDDGPQHFPGIRQAFVSGRHLTWYGPSLAEAHALLRSQLCSAHH